VPASSSAATNELAEAVATVGEGIVVYDAAGYATLANPAVEKILRHPAPPTFGELLDEFEVPAEARVSRRSGRGELRLRDSGRWIEVRRSSLTEARPRAEGEPEGGFIVVLRDVSRAREARVDRDAFLGVLSHELRTPITTIYVGSRLLAREEDAPAARRDIAADIEAEAERLFRLVEDLLVVTHSERGALEMAVEPVLLQHVVETSVRLERERSPGTKFVVSVREDLPPVEADSRHVVHLMRNLLANAVEHSGGEEGSDRIDVDIATNGEGVSVRIVDRGRRKEPAGAQAAIVAEGVDAAVARSAGDGISLLVCDRLVRAMGGRIWVRRHEEGGNEFGFWLRRYLDG
jgi:signal transduction histidine kinase